MSEPRTSAREQHSFLMKGACPQAEIARLPAGVGVDAVHRLTVPGVEGERHLLVLRKTLDEPPQADSEK